VVVPDTVIYTDVVPVTVIDAPKDADDCRIPYSVVIGVDPFISTNNFEV
jgi:hypothetical protein